jgi:threonine/homoserine/homoserine lactone efflux protein
VVFETMPGLEVVLKYVAFAYLLWLAWRMAQAGRPETWPHSPETSQFF